MSNKVGFWTVFIIVISSQIGSGVLLQPMRFAKYGLLSIFGLLTAAVGAIALALVFSKLCSWIPRTGGPHAYIKETFGESTAFFTGWTYWIVAWISSTAVVTEAVAYLMPLTGTNSPVVALILGILLILICMALNFRGLSFSGRADIFLWLLKAVPLLLVPIAGLYFFNINNFVIEPVTASLGMPTILSGSTLVAIWGFIGIETATTAVGSVENASKTIPKAVIFGTIFVALLYILNSIGVMGVIPGSELMSTTASYTVAAKNIFGGNWYLIISIISAIICFGTLNAWTITSGQISLGLAQDKFMPAIFGRKNKHDVPLFGLIISCLGVVLAYVMTSGGGLAKQVATIINVSVTSFLFVYAICCLAFFKILLRPVFDNFRALRVFRGAGGESRDLRESVTKILWPFVYGLVALAFCVWTIYQTPINEILIASLFTFSGIPFYLKFRASKIKFLRTGPSSGSRTYFLFITIFLAFGLSSSIGAMLQPLARPVVSTLSVNARGFSKFLPIINREFSKKTGQGAEPSSEKLSPEKLSPEQFLREQVKDAFCMPVILSRGVLPRTSILEKTGYECSVETRNFVHGIAKRLGINNPGEIRIMHNDNLKAIDQFFVQNRILFVPNLDNKTITQEDLFGIAHELAHIKYKCGLVLALYPTIVSLSFGVPVAIIGGVPGVIAGIPIAIIALKLAQKTQEALADISAASLGQDFAIGGIKFFKDYIEKEMGDNRNKKVGSISFFKKHINLTLSFMNKLLDSHPSPKNRLRYLERYKNKHYKTDSVEGSSKLDSKLDPMFEELSKDSNRISDEPSKERIGEI